KSYSGGCITSLTDATGCPGLFPPLPTTTSLIANTTSICRGASVLLTAAASGAASYSFDNGSSWQTANTKTVSPTVTTTYTLKVRSSTGCTSTDSRTVSVSVTQLSAQDEVVNSCGCASGLTKVGSYCRDLVADNAGAYTCNNVVIEVKNTCNNYTTWSSANSACTGIGWRLPTLDELKCLANSSVIIWSVGGGDCYKNTKCEGCDWWLQGNGCRTVVNQGYSCNNCSDCTCVQYNAKYFCVRN
ncbi:MAG: hypothetical protein LBF81_01730, partial [Prevotellaceae bacterium]|nr:hypothetical protein [Prevotellaceae bacterium]